MKILFIYTNINGFHDNCYSFGLASIMSITRAKGHEVKILIIKSKDEYSKIIAEIGDFKPKVVGFSSVSSQFNCVKELAQLIKTQFPETIVICGGVHPTINPECVLESEFLDGIFTGESEYSFIEFLQNIENNRPYKHTDNFVYADNKKVVINKLKPLISNLDGLPYPDREIYPSREIVRKDKIAHFLFSRGCPYSCTYCSNKAIAKIYGLAVNHPRYRTVESSICEIEDVINKFSVEMVYIMDDIFGLDKIWRDEFCKKYKKRVNLRFICLLRANVINEDFVKLLKSAGCYLVQIGVESGNDYVRNKIMKRQMQEEQIIKAFNIVHRYGLLTNAINIIGVPGETEEMIWDTIKLNRKLKPTASCVNIFYPYKGTELGDYCFGKDLVNKSLYYDFSNERRDSVLNYPYDYKKKLIYYRDNWEKKVYPLTKRLKIYIFSQLQKTFLWKYMGRLKRYIKRVKD